MSSMKHRWMDVMKRVSAPSSASPRSVNSSPHDPNTTTSHSSKDATTASHSAATKRRSFALTLPGISTVVDDGNPNKETPEHVAFVHFAERCDSVGECSVSKVLELCMLQGGVHHTHMNILTYLGSPLRVDTCCYVMSVQWFRAVGDREDFQLIPDACDEWFTPTADDIGAKILAKVAMQDEDAVRTKLLEYGPIKEDPEVRSKVETYLERRSVLFMGLESLSVQDSGEHYPNNIDMRESWTLLIDDRRVRLTCESSLLPPFEGFYTSSIRVEIVRCSPNEFYLFLADNCYVHLRAESNTVRDIITLTLRAFCRSAVSSELINDAISKGMSPMLTIRTLAAAEHHEQQLPNSRSTAPPMVTSPPSFSLPWNQPTGADGAILIDEDIESDGDDSRTDRSSEGGITRLRTTSESHSVTSSDFYNDSTLQDAEALIGNAMKMGLQNHLLLPKAPKQISVAEIADLQIIEAMENNDDDSTSVSSLARRRRPLSKKSNGQDIRSRSSSLDVQGSTYVSDSQRSGDNEASGSTTGPEIDDESFEEAIRTFQREELDEIETLRSRYVAIFCEMQRELHESKARAKSLGERLERTTEENKAFRSDITLLQDALSSVQFANEVRTVVTKNLDHVVKPNATNDRKPGQRDLFF